MTPLDMKILKIPFGEGGLGKTKDTAKAPDKIEKELKEIYLNENLNQFMFSCEEVKVENSNLSQTHKIIEKKIKNIDGRVVSIGGDHSITYSAFKGSQKSGLIVFDAHPDLMTGTQTPSHEDYLRKLIEEGYLNPEDVVLAGLRNIHGQEYEFLKENNIKHFTAKHIHKNGIANICDSLMETARKWDNFYISVDIDVLDPAFAPATVHAEPAGLSTRDLLYIIQRLKFLNKSFDADLVEVSPSMDVNSMTSRVAAKIISEF